MRRRTSSGFSCGPSRRDDDLMHEDARWRLPSGWEATRRLKGNSQTRPRQLYFCGAPKRADLRPPHTRARRGPMPPRRLFLIKQPDALVNGKSPGQPSKLNDLQRQAIADMIERGPIPAVHGAVRWRLIDLAQWIFEEFAAVELGPPIIPNWGAGHKIG